jgi:hypothetical protein
MFNSMKSLLVFQPVPPAVGFERWSEPRFARAVVGYALV